MVLNQKDTVSGYGRVWWNGVTTLELAKAIAYAIERPKVGGLIHLAASETVTKLELLSLFRDVFNRSIHDHQAGLPHNIDRTLQCTRQDWHYETPGYRFMLEELKRWMNEAEPPAPRHYGRRRL